MGVEVLPDVKKQSAAPVGSSEGHRSTLSGAGARTVVTCRVTATTSFPAYGGVASSIAISSMGGDILVAARKTPRAAASSVGVVTNLVTPAAVAIAATTSVGCR